LGIFVIFLIILTYIDGLETFFYEYYDIKCLMLGIIVVLTAIGLFILLYRFKVITVNVCVKALWYLPLFNYVAEVF
jgi:hypothetical protein